MIIKVDGIDINLVDNILDDVSEAAVIVNDKIISTFKNTKSAVAH